jgi:hypothetical protein
MEGHAFVSIHFLSRVWIIDMLPQTKDLLQKNIYVMNEESISKY